MIFTAAETRNHTVPARVTVQILTEIDSGGPKISEQVHGNITGLKPAQTKAIERLYRRRVPATAVSTAELNARLAEISRDTGRQIGVMIDRKGVIVFVIIGSAHGIELPDVGRHRAGRARLRGLRLIHTHLQGEGLTRDDLTDLALLRLDYVAAIEVSPEGRPDRWYGAHVVAANDAGNMWTVEPAISCHDALAIDFDTVIRELEAELTHSQQALHIDGDGPRAILVQVTTPRSHDSEVSMMELRELASTAGVRVVDEMYQHRVKVDPRTCLGRGKISDLTLHSMQLGAELAIFDTNLTPTQVRSIADATDIKVIDRTQLILDIFAQRARTREGKLQVELAQLKYMLPRLSRSTQAFSRLAGGIGGRGPGEQKLEIDRRRVKDRITLLQKQLKKVAKSRSVRRRQRGRNQVPVVSIVGYTNAGKSTLLNTLTQSNVFAENKLFATLDPTSRRLRFPREREIVITDTVGFIRDLPPDLIQAFSATLEEMEDADALLHVVDISNPSAEEHMATVDQLLHELKLDDRPVIRVLNKADRLPDPDDGPRLEIRLNGIAVSARSSETLLPLMNRLEHTLWQVS
ncbi:MAG TPA: GTPase HflX [Myxococcales bacterium]|nr:GTPase HflX [Myxococcales bacterium]